MRRCISIGELKDTSRISQMCHECKEPVMITQNGIDDMVIMSAEVYEKIRLYSVYEKLMESEEDVTRGNVSDAFQSLEELRAEYGLEN